MLYLGNAASFLIELVFGVLMLVLMLRLLLQLVGANPYNPVSQSLLKLTNPVLIPLRRAFKPWRRLETGALLLLVLLALIKLILLAAVRGMALSPIAALVLAVGDILDLALLAMIFALIVLVIVSWIGPVDHPVIGLLQSLTSPLLRPIRRRMPDFGGIDFSPIVAFVLLMLARILLLAPLLDFGTRLMRMGW